MSDYWTLGRPTRGRGVDRVPESIAAADTYQMDELEVPERGVYKGVTASRHERRAMGQRAGRKPRRRELPGAEARRIAKNQKEWAA